MALWSLRGAHCLGSEGSKPQNYCVLGSVVSAVQVKRLGISMVRDVSGKGRHYAKSSLIRRFGFTQLVKTIWRCIFKRKAT